MTRSRRRKGAFVVPVTSMGDIAFLLIIFFMLCSNFARETGINVEPPQSIDVDDLEKTAVSVQIDKEGQIYLQGVQIDDVEAIEWAVAAFIKDAKTDKDKIVLFKCDASVDRAVFEPVIEAIAKGGGLIGAIGDKTDGDEEGSKR